MTPGSFDISDRDGAAERRIAQCVAAAQRLLILARGPSAADPAARPRDSDAVLVTDPTYVTRDVYGGDPAIVLIGDRSAVLPGVAQRWQATPPERRPLLLYGYIPAATRDATPEFGAMGLGMPLPILPMLARHGLYDTPDAEVYPTSGVFLTLVAAALGKPAVAAGIDLYRHPTGQLYHNPHSEQPMVAWPKRHSEACDVAHLRRAARLAGPRIMFLGVAAEALAVRQPLH